MTDDLLPLTPSLSVIITTHNRAHLLPDAIRSVLASPLISTRDQVIVVDDASTDSTPDVAAQFDVTYVRVRKGTPGGTRNAGLALVETEFITFLDDDDCWLPGNMEPQLAALRACPEAAFAYARAQRTTEDRTPFGDAIPEPPLPSGLLGGLMAPLSPQVGIVLFRREKLEAIGGYQEDLLQMEDRDVLIRLAVRYPVVGVDFTGMLFRSRDESHDLDGHYWRYYEDYLAVRKRWKRDRVPLSRNESITVSKWFRGKISYYLSVQAEMFSTAGDHGRARDFLVKAFRVSPVHCLTRHREFRLAAVRSSIRRSRP